MSEGHAGFVLPLLRSGMRVLDVGCGAAVNTLSLGTAAHPIRVLGLDRDPDSVAAAHRAARHAAVGTVDFVVALARALPLPAACADVVFAHGLLADEPDQAAVLTEFSRVLRPGGTLALSTPDWSRVRLRPHTANVDAALRGWQLLRRRAGADPYAGRWVDDRVRRAGFRDVRSRTRHLADYDYRQLARDVEAELAGAVRTDDGIVDQQLASSARSAWMWVRGGPGDVSRCWRETLAVR